MADAEKPRLLTKAERILVALDESEFSQAALDQAIQLGKLCGSKIYALSVVDLYPGTMSLAADVEEELCKAAWKIVHDAQEKVQNEGLECETLVHMGGQPHEFIVREARDNDVDVIILGTHGRSGLRKVLVGSVAERVIGHAPCPVLVTPKPH